MLLGVQEVHALLGGGHSSQSVGRTFRGRGGGLCHAAGDMRAYGAREGIAGTYGAGDSAGYGGYGAGDSGEI